MKDIMLNYYKHIALPACLALIFGMPLAVQADHHDSEAGNDDKQERQQDTTANGDSSNVDLDAKTKEKFVAAYVEIKDVQKKYSKQMENMDDQSKARELQKQAQAEMVKIVESNDMTVEKYNQVVSAISNDPDLRMEIEKMAKTQAD